MILSDTCLKYVEEQKLYKFLDDHFIFKYVWTCVYVLVPVCDSVNMTADAQRRQKKMADTLDLALQGVGNCLMETPGLTLGSLEKEQSHFLSHWTISPKQEIYMLNFYLTGRMFLGTKENWSLINFILLIFFHKKRL